MIGVIALVARTPLNAVERKSSGTSTVLTVFSEVGSSIGGVEYADECWM